MINFLQYWLNIPSGIINFSKLSLKEVVKHLIEKCYFQVGNLCLLQTNGIHMSIDHSPIWANLHLAWYESSFVSKAINSNPVTALKLNGCSRFIDDMVCLNDRFEFEKHRSEIYPKDLELKCEHLGTSATFLELDIVIQNNIFVHKLFDKRDAFPFSIVRMPDLSSNIPSNIFYGAVFSELLRIGRATLLFDDFVP